MESRQSGTAYFKINPPLLVCSRLVVFFMLRVTLSRPDGVGTQDFPLSRLEYFLTSISSYAWIDLACPTDDELNSVFKEVFPIHGLAMDVVLQEEGTSKIGNFGDYISVVFHILEPSPDSLSLDVVECAAIIGHQLLITVNHHSELCFEKERREFNEFQGFETAESLGTAGLLYRLMDRKAEISRQQVESFEDRLESQGDAIFNRGLSSKSQHMLMDEILSAKASALRIHSTLAPQVQVLEELGNLHFAVIPSSSRIYFLDLRDHVQYLVSKSASMRDIATSTIATHQTIVSHRLNEVMKVLTMIATIFIPLTFVTSVYGMNFRFMPELGWYWSYPAVLIFCLFVALIMIFYFRYRRWF